MKPEPPESNSAATPDEVSQAARKEPRDVAYWAQYTERMKVLNVPDGATNMNVDGRRALSPLQGFGRMWQKTYKVRLEGADVSPQEVIRIWKQDFPKFWGATAIGSRFYAPAGGLAPGEVVLINADTPGGGKMSTGIMVMYADDESFTFMTPEGHPFSGWVTFSAYDVGGVTVAQAQVLIRPNDPLYELAMPLGLGKTEDQIWLRTLEALSRHFGLKAPVEMKAVVVDRKLQWSQAGNIWHNAILRSVVSSVQVPARRIRLLVGRRIPRYRV